VLQVLRWVGTDRLWLCAAAPPVTGGAPRL